jgi:hypothetical protein
MAIKTGLQVDRDTIVIPFSAQTKQGREEIYEVIDSIILNNIPDTTGDDGNEEES